MSPVRWEQALSVARAARLDGPVVITSPVAAGRAWTVAQAGDRWPVRRDAIAVDPDRWRVVDRVDWADHPLPAKLTTLGVLLHMGRLFGPLNQLALAGTALALLAMIGWGYRMWWLRRPRRAGRRAMGRPPARTGWRALPHRGPVIAVALPVVAFAGWAVPLLGLSLVAFVLLDGVARAVVRRRAAPSDRGPGRRSR